MKCLIPALLLLAAYSPLFGAYGFQRSVTVQSGQVTGTQTNYPMAFSGTYAYLATIANGGNVQNANGYDIAFFSDSAGTMPLSCEQESYNATTGAVVYWVNVPSITTSTVIYMFYGDSSISTAQCGVTGTWDANHSMVLHLPNGSTLSMTDSTGNNTVTNSGSATATSTNCIADGCASFNGTSNYLSAPNSSSLLLGTNMTLEIWLDIPSACGGAGTCNVFFDKRNGGHGYFLGYNLSGGGQNFAEFFLSGSTTSCDYYGGNITVGSKAYIVATYDGSTMKVYNGGSVVANTGGCNGIVATGSTNDSMASLFIGRLAASGTLFMNGPGDEIRISNTARSAGWINTVWKNLTSPSSFYTVGSAVVLSGFISNPSVFGIAVQ